MPKICSVHGCTSSSSREWNKSFYKIPKVRYAVGEHIKKMSEKRREVWIQNLCLTSENEDVWENALVCSDHFVTGHPSASVYEETPDWAPTINILCSSGKCLKKEMCKRYSDSVCQTELTMEDLTKLEEAVNGLSSKISILRQEIVNSEFGQEAFHDEEKTRFYTGMPNFSSLIQIFELCEPYIGTSAFLSLPKFEQFIMVLMRLRLNLHFQDLAYRFKVSTATVSQIWVEGINILHKRLKSKLGWPERDILLSAMPASFRTAFGNKVAVILNCFEVFIKTPANLSARAPSQSNHKHQKTVKFLTAVDPDGDVAYVSRCWGGVASDQLIAEECGVLKNLSPGDVVLADRGFKVKDGIGFYCACIKTPIGTKLKKRLSAYDSEQARKLESVRVHVQRVSGVVQRKYQILQSQTVPVEHTDVKSNDSLALIEKVAVICCVLSNLSKTVEPPE